MNEIQIVAFDADDTLWANQPFFDQSQERFCELMAEYMPKEQIEKELLKIEVENLSIYGYGAKGYALSMTEAALKISDNRVSPNAIKEIIGIAKNLLDYPVTLLEGVEETLDSLVDKYKLVVATKGDPLDQQAKLKRSGIGNYFQHIEVMTNKQVGDYNKLMENLECDPNKFLMIGNSLKSDILPVIEIGGRAVHIPFYSTWEHEKVADNEIDHSRFVSISKIKDVLPLLITT